MTKILLTWTLLFAIQIFAQTKNTSRTTDRINAYLSELEKIGFSGTVLVESGGKKIISKGYGYSDRMHALKNEPSTIFDIGSLTKQFTAAAILKLEMQGKLSTGDPIAKYFDNVPVDKSGITIHDLLRHQSGLQSNVGRDFDTISETAFIDTVMNSKLKFEIGTQFSYSNIGYSLLAIIIEKVSGNTYENYLYENLWKPAKMEMTGYTRPKFDASQIAVGYDNNDSAWGKPTDKAWNTTAPYWHLKGNGGILSTTEDMYRWHQALMDETILSKEAKNKLYHPKPRTGENNDAMYAYGWDVSKTDRNTFRVWHNGTNRIFYADFMRFIDEGVTLIMLSNKSHQNFDRLNFTLANMIFDENYTPQVPIADNETNRQYTQTIIDLILKEGFEAGKNEFKKRKSGTDILEHVLNIKGYDLLSEKKYDEAIAVFIMNVFAYPESANAYDSLGEAYMNKGDKTLAIKNYEKSLELDPHNGNAKDMLKELRK